MRYFSIILALALLAVLLGCVQNSEGFSLNQTFQIKEGATYQNSAEGLSIKVISFTDSRCPRGVKCIWAGEQGTNLSVSTPNSLSDINVYLGEMKRFYLLIDSNGNAVNFALISIDVEKRAAEIKVTSIPGNQIACTMEAKLCPDGSAVGRAGPLCNFTPCPGE